jgi:hypothetical protein
MRKIDDMPYIEIVFNIDDKAFDSMEITDHREEFLKALLDTVFGAVVNYIKHSDPTLLVHITHTTTEFALKLAGIITSMFLGEEVQA